MEDHQWQSSFGHSFTRVRYYISSYAHHGNRRCSSPSLFHLLWACHILWTRKTCGSVPEQTRTLFGNALSVGFHYAGMVAFHRDVNDFFAYATNNLPHPLRVLNDAFSTANLRCGDNQHARCLSYLHSSADIFYVFSHGCYSIPRYRFPSVPASGTSFYTRDCSLPLALTADDDYLLYRRSTCSPAHHFPTSFQLRLPPAFAYRRWTRTARSAAFQL